MAAGASGARCREIETVGYGEYRCRLSGNGVELNCRSLTEAPCIPRLAVMLRAGSLRLADLSKEEREAVRIMAEHLEMKELNFDEMSGEELDEWAGRIAAAKRDRRRAARQRETLLPWLVARSEKLMEQRVALGKEIGTIEKHIEALKEGRPVDVISLNRRKPLTEAQKAAMRENAAKARAARAERGGSSDAERQQKKRDYQREWRRDARKKVEAQEAA